MSDFLIEILTEELPHSEIESGEKKILQIILNLFQKLNLSSKNIKAFSTPNRLSVLATQIPSKTIDRERIQKGPLLSRCFSEGQATHILIGFAKSCQTEIPKIDRLRKLKEIPLDQRKKGFYIEQNGEKDLLIFYEIIPGQITEQILADHLPQALEQLTFEKMMYWGEKKGPFLRPIKGLLCLLDSKTIPFTFKGVHTSNRTLGYSHSRELVSFSIDHPGKYETQLLAHQVMVDRHKRLSVINRWLETFEQNHPEDKIIEKLKISQIVSCLTEYPSLYPVDFEEELLNIPQEVTISEMVEHQKYFPIKSAKLENEGRLKPTFIITANGKFDQPQAIIKGNRNVLSSRLRDGFFLYQADLKLGLKKLAQKLNHVVYEKTLGSYHQKSLRNQGIALELNRILSHHQVKPLTIQPKLIVMAAPLLKADLASGMVGEFPHLQGVIGRYYALESKSIEQEHRQAIAEAIQEHYFPLGAKGKLPSSPLGVLFSLAEKLENLMGIFSIGFIPTGSHDPYALRRQTQGMIRILIENKLSIDLADLISSQMTIYHPFFLKSHETAILDQLLKFIKNRFLTFLKKDYPTENINAVLNQPSLNPYQQVLSLKSLEKFSKEKAFPELIGLLKRISNIISDRKNFDKTNQKKLEIDVKIFSSRYEVDLFSQYQHMQKEIQQVTSVLPLTIDDYFNLFILFSHYQKPLSNFFDHVLVMTDDQIVKQNRLSLLTLIKRQIDQWIDYDSIKLTSS